MDTFQKKSFVPEGVSSSDLILLYVLVTVVMLALLIMTTIITDQSVGWIALYVGSSIVYLVYAYYLISINQSKKLGHLINILILWSVVYIVLQGVYILVTYARGDL